MPLVWFAVRREWRALAEVVGCTVVIVAVSVAVDLQAWLDWGEFLLSNRGEGDVVERAVRWVLAVLVVAWGARSDRTWVLPVGLFLALPHFGWKNKDFSVLLGAAGMRARTEPRPASPDGEAGRDLRAVGAGGGAATQSASISRTNGATSVP